MPLQSVRVDTVKLTCTQCNWDFRSPSQWNIKDGRGQEEAEIPENSRMYQNIYMIIGSCEGSQQY